MLHKMQTKTVSVLFIIGILCASSIFAGTPHTVYGTVRYADGTFPGSLSFSAYITSRPGETLSQSSSDCDYDNSTGTWYVQCGNFPTSWTSGDNFHINFNDGAGATGSDDITLNTDPFQNAGATTLSRPSVQITIATSPSGQTISIDGSNYTSPKVFSWLPGSSHTIAVSSPQNGSTGTRYVYTSWSDGGGQSHSYTVPSSNQTVTASFKTQYYLTTSASPSAGGTLSPAPPGGWYDSGSSASLNASESGGYQWTGWSGDLSGSTRPQNLTMNGPKSVTANFSRQVQITIGTSPSGRSFTVDGSTYSSTQSFNWLEGSSHTLALTSPQNGSTGTRYEYTSWSDGGGQSHSYTVPSSNQTVTASFKTQYQLTVNSAYGSPTGAGWYDSGTSATFGITSPASGGTGTRYAFTGWTGSGSGSYSGSSASSSVTMNNAITETAAWTTQYYLTATENPSAGGDISPAAPGQWANSGSTISVDAATASGYFWVGWSGDLTGTARPRNITMTGPKSVTANFGKQVQITINTNPAGRSFTVDGTLYTNSQTFSWTANETHTLSGSSPQSDSPGTRYLFSSWSDGGAQTHVYTVPGSNATVTAGFQTQYELSVISPYGSPTGAGWYNAGSSATFGVTTPVNGAAGIRYLFSAWTGSGSGAYTGTSVSRTITMNNPVTETAGWTTQYQLTVVSAHGSPTGAGWYNSGTAVAFGITSPENAGTGTRYFFTGWTGSGSGSYTGSGTSTSVTMNNPVTETASWNTQYYLTTAENPAAGGDISPAVPGQWANSGSTISINASPAAGYQWAGWSGDLSGTARPQNITMNGPKSVTAKFGKQVQITVNASPAGRSFTVDGILYSSAQTFTWIENETHVLSGSSPQSSGPDTRYLFASWSNGGIQTQTYTVPASNATVTASFQLQYKLTINADHGSPKGTGWHNAGATALFSVTCPEYNGDSRYLLDAWSGDYSGTDKSGSILMNGPKVLNTTWHTEHFLDIHSDYGNPQGKGWYTEGATAHFSVSTPDTRGNTRYIFRKYSGDCTSLNASGSVVMFSGKDITAEWRVEYYLFTQAAPAAGGQIVPPPPGKWIGQGDAVTITATPDQTKNYGFGGWTGDLTGNENPKTLTMTQSFSVTANFNFNGQIQVTSQPEGLTVTVDNAQYVTPHNFIWPAGSKHNISVSALQASGEKTEYRYAGWSDGGAQSHEITVTDIILFTALYDTYYYLDISAEPVNGGTVDPVVPGDWFKQNSIVQMTAAPDISLGYIFTGWTGDLAGQTNPAALLMDTPKQVQGQFAPGSHTLTVGALPDGQGAVQIVPEKTAYTHGEHVMLIAVPAEGYTLANWSGDAGSEEDTLNLVMDRDLSIQANFIISDQLPPRCSSFYPPENATHVPVNTRIQFTLNDRPEGTGVDPSTLYLTVNKAPVLIDGIPQNDGSINIRNTSSGIAVTYRPATPFTENSTVRVLVQCFDKASPPNILYKEIAFEVGFSKVDANPGIMIGPQGGTFISQQTGMKIIVPQGAVEESTEFIFSLVDSLPSGPEGVDFIGLRLHLWPEGYSFSDTVIIAIPYTQSLLEDSGVANPVLLGVYQFSTRTGQWSLLRICDVDDTHIYVQVTELCYFTLANTQNISDIDQSGNILPGEFQLQQNYPNPFNPVTMIRYSIPHQDHVSLAVYNMQGQQVRTLIGENQQPGIYQVLWNGQDDLGNNVGSGVYLFILNFQNQRKSVKSIFMK